MPCPGGEVSFLSDLNRNAETGTTIGYTLNAASQVTSRVYPRWLGGSKRLKTPVDIGSHARDVPLDIQNWPNPLMFGHLAKLAG